MNRADAETLAELLGEVAKIVEADLGIYATSYAVDRRRNEVHLSTAGFSAVFAGLPTAVNILGAYRARYPYEHYAVLGGTKFFCLATPEEHAELMANAEDAA